MLPEELLEVFRVWRAWQLVSVRTEITHQAGNPAHCLGVLLQVQHELLALSYAPEIGVVIIAVPTPSVGVVSQRSLATVGIESARKPPLGHWAARLRQNETFIKSRENSRPRRCRAVA